MIPIYFTAHLIEPLRITDLNGSWLDAASPLMPSSDGDVTEIVTISSNRFYRVMVNPPLKL